MFEKIKRKIKFAKIWIIIFLALFIFMLISNIFLIIKIFSLKEENKSFKKEIDWLKNIIQLSE